MLLTNLLSPATIALGLHAPDKKSAINQTVDLLSVCEQVTDLEEVRRVVQEREEIMSTGVGKGLGLPHGKSATVPESVAALSVISSPIDFEAFDGEPVRILFLLVGPPEAQTVHIRTLSRISRIMSDEGTRKDILSAGTPEEVFDTLVEAERALLAEDPR